MGSGGTGGSTRTRIHVIVETSRLERVIAYRSPLRDDQAAATRERILDAAHRLLGRIRPVDLAYAQVAEEAEVSVRTVYRHFPAPEDLFRALSDRLVGRMVVGDGEPIDPGTLGGSKEMLRRQFRMMDDDVALFRLFFAVPTRSRGNPEAMFVALFGDRVAHLPPDQQRAVYALLDLLASPYAWDVLHQNWGVEGERLFAGVMFGLRAVLELAERSPELLAPGVDPFPVPPQEKQP